MYIPAHFEPPRTELLFELMRACPLATVVVNTAAGLSADHLPLLLRPEDGPGPGRLVGHVARGNPLWRLANPSVEVLAIFHGPEGYVSPNWYATKAETGKVVPTWNYAVVHTHGVLRAIEDVSWLRQLVTELTDHHEQSQPKPWRVADAPADFTESRLAAIVGIEIEITRLVGKWKLSQNQPAENRRSVIEGLRNLGTASGQTMASWVEQATQPSKPGPV